MIFYTRGKDAFRIAFDNYADTVYRVAIHNTANKEDADDITQEVFLKLLEHNKPIKGDEHLKAWLIRVTINLCHDTYRKNSRLEVVERPIPDSVVSESDSVLEAVRLLPENYRNTIYLHYYEGYTAKEIGKILSAKESTVLSWLSRGRASLKEMIGGENDE